MEPIKSTYYSPFSSLNMNSQNPLPLPESIWCRIVFASFEQPNIKQHCHSFFELHLCLEGSCEYDLAGKRLTLHKGSYLLVSPGMLHTIISESCDFKKFIWGFNIADEALSGMMKLKCSEEPLKEYSKEICNALTLMTENENNKALEYYSVIISQLMVVYAYILRDYISLRNADADNKFRRKPSAVFNDIKGFISDNLRYNPLAPEIAAQFSVSQSTLDRLCRKECGLSVAALKKSIQFDKIKNLLISTDYTLDNISECCGFADRYTMGKFFKSMEGMAPGEFRRSYLK